MRRNALTAALVVAAWLGTSPASAGILEFRAQLQAGGASGKGISGGQKDNAFHEGAAGMSYGGLVGVEILLVDVWVEHNQYTGSDGLRGTWTQFMTGLDVKIDLGEKNRGGSGDKGEYTSMFLEAGVGVGFGVGTGQQVVLPLDNSQVTDKGFLANAHVALGYRLNKLLSVGLTLPIQAAYMFKSGDGIVANDESTHYRSVQGAAMLNLRMELNLK